MNGERTQCVLSTAGTAFTQVTRVGLSLFDMQDPVDPENGF